MRVIGDMSRPLRIQFPGAWHHVMNWGRKGDRRFEGKGDYSTFIDLLKYCVEMWNIRMFGIISIFWGKSLTAKFRIRSSGVTLLLKNLYT